MYIHKFWPIGDHHKLNGTVSSPLLNGSLQSLDWTTGLIVGQPLTWRNKEATSHEGLAHKTRLWADVVLASWSIRHITIQLLELSRPFHTRRRCSKVKVNHALRLLKAIGKAWTLLFISADSPLLHVCSLLSTHAYTPQLFIMGGVRHS